MPFEKYEKVTRMDKTDEVEGILDGKVYLFEKLDGANASIWIENGVVFCASRNRIVGQYDTTTQTKIISDTFRGLPEYVFSNTNLLNLLTENPYLKLYGEWVVKHTVIYPTKHLNRLYFFDVKDTNTNRYLHYDEYTNIFMKYNMAQDFIPTFIVLENPKMPDILEWLGTTIFEGKPNGEGIVLKRYDFINRYGRTTYGKIVTKEFKETNRRLFDHDKNLPIEAQIAGVYVTYSRVKKVIDKIKDSSDGSISIKDTGRIIGTVYHDVVTEEIWQIIKKHKKPTINFTVLEKECTALTKNIFFGILQEGE